MKNRHVVFRTLGRLRMLQWRPRLVALAAVVTLLVVVVVGPALTQLLEHRPRVRIAYNVSVVALAATAAGMVAAPLGHGDDASGVLARVGAAASAQYTVNLVLITAVVAVSSRRSIF